MAEPAHSLRGRATTIKPEILKDIAMADKQNTLSDKAGAQNGESAFKTRTYSTDNYQELSPKVDAVQLEVTEKTRLMQTLKAVLNKFPDFKPKQESSRKIKSLSTSATVDLAVFADEDRTAAINRMKTTSPPLDLQQARKRRESVKDSAKEIRKASVSLLRSRTASRVEAQGRPNLEEIKRLD
ncbi:hypothetical protein D0Z07_8266 [Hyphodiscus hymeniophilus]|uniref:Uncharacterized protein n=1 Tax=Hyphodiscus hymeniophilus TaxID=353542 RepID=A0A9P6SQ00_9HELO|nr:hypothetical protein D0Z07_8266 [Hyphodiscus hymeniophilus]